MPCRSLQGEVTDGDAEGGTCLHGEAWEDVPERETLFCVSVMRGRCRKEPRKGHLAGPGELQCVVTGAGPGHQGHMGHPQWFLNAPLCPTRLRRWALGLVTVAPPVPGMESRSINQMARAALVCLI